MNITRLATAMACLTASLAAYAEGPAAGGTPPGRTLHLFPTMYECGPNPAMVIVYRLTNTSKEPYAAKLPYRWYGLVWDWFDVYHDGTKLENRLAEKDYGFDKTTHLAPGESVTIAFRLATVAKLPEDHKALLGKYEVKARKIDDQSATALPIDVLDSATFAMVDAPKQIVPDIIPNRLQTEADFAKAKSMVNNHGLSAAFRGAALWRIAGLKCDSHLWQIVENCDEPYVVANFLQSLPSEWTNKDALLSLMRSKDLTLRREAIRAMPKLLSNRAEAKNVHAVAKELREFLKTQKDEPTLEYARQTLEILENKRSPIIEESKGLKVARIAGEERTIAGKTCRLISIGGIPRSRSGYDQFVIDIVQPHKWGGGGSEGIDGERWYMRGEDSPPGIYLYWVEIAPKGTLEIRHGSIFQDAALPPDEWAKRIAKFPVLRLKYEDIPVIEALALDHLGDKMKSLPPATQAGSSTAPGK